MHEDKFIVGTKVAVIFSVIGVLCASATARIFRFEVSDILALPTTISSAPLWVSLVLSAVLTYVVYAICFRPLNRIVDDCFGYYTDPCRSRKYQVERLRRLRKLGDPPPAFANGWYPVIESHRLQKGEVQSANMIGLALAVFRDTSGTAHVLDAYCPHLGANLAAGGRVVNDCLECPFHAWRFRGDDGRCVYVPILGEDEKIPEKARVHSYNVHEVNGWIHFWFDAEGREPHWTIPDIEDIQSGELTYRGRCEHIIYSHMEDLPENGADMAHLPVVHNPSLFKGDDLRHFSFDSSWCITSHDFIGTWEPVPAPNEHKALMKVTQSFKLFGKTVPGSQTNVHIEQVGPAVVYLNFTTALGRIVISHVVLPQEPMVQKLVHHIYAQGTIPTFVAKIFLFGMTKHVDRDVYIWNSKCYKRQPFLLKTSEDSTLQKHRRWYRQFYSENSPKVQAKVKDGLEW